MEKDGAQVIDFTARRQAQIEQEHDASLQIAYAEEVGRTGTALVEADPCLITSLEREVPLLPLEELTVLRLHIVEGLPSEVVGLKMGIDEYRIKELVFSGLRKLRERVFPEN